MSADPRASASSLPEGVRDGLARAVRERDAIRVAGPPPGRARAGARGLLAASALALLAGWGALLARGYGRPASPTTPWSELPVHVVLATGAAFAATRARSRGRAGAAEPGPLADGTYLFPRGVLVADGGALTAFPGDAAGPRVEVATEGGRRELVVRREGGAVALRVAVTDASPDAALLHLASRRESAGAAVFDAFVAASGKAPASLPPEGGAARRVVPVVLASGLIAAGALAARNAMSDAAALARAKAAAEGAGDAALLAAYADAGGMQAASVRRELLPRAEAARLVREGTVEELDRFVAEHPGTRAADDARGARADVLHRDFLARTDMASLRAFVRQHPDAPDVPQARAKMHALYMEARHALLRAPGSGSDPDAAVVWSALLAWLEAHDDAPPIPVRFRRSAASSLARADAMLARGLLDDDGPARGGNAAASPHFDARHAERRERAVVLALEHALAKDLPPDVLHLALGPPLPAKPDLGASPDQVPVLARPAPSAHVSAPEVLVEYEVAWSGQSYVGREGGRRYVGVAFQFFVVLAVPGADATVDLVTRVEPEATFAVDYTTWDPSLRAALPEGADAGARPGLDDERVYEVMALRAFDQMASRFRERAFGAK